MPFRFESFAWDLSLGTFRDRSLRNVKPVAPASWFVRLDFVTWNLSIRIFRLQYCGIFRSPAEILRRPAGTFAWDFSLGNFRLLSSALKASIGNLCLGSFAWELSLDSFRLGYFVWEPSLWNFRFGTFALELVLRNFRLETLAWEPSVLRNFRLGTFAWEL